MHTSFSQGSLVYRGHVITLFIILAAEVVLHRECVDRHCKGILEVLEDCRTDIQELQIQKNKMTEDFQMQIYSREKDFTCATNYEK